ncbi:phage terminase large subunit [Epilithonimonas hungarica]|uniref:Phage terminase, large subunit, PBSX family n=1 Tax=Epilithonimonas hungarica TaxID=454006 RepID=A0A1G7JWF1_9FLAO|nr:phage terminase large subunit [Epilithonimonas hungarica]SDF29256.1 phage terminase, large subunit, PBSX family [Epilithonimonas hungarica]
MIIDFSKYYVPKAKQEEAHKCRAKYLLFGGSFGAGKSWFLTSEAIKNAMMFKGNRLVIVRKELSVLRRTTLVTFLSICPPEIIKSFNQTSLEVTFINDSVLIFIDANIAKDPLLQKIKGLEIGWFGIEEANEVSLDVYNLLKTRLRWVLPNGEKPRYEGRLTSNPEACWLIPTFIQSKNIDEVYIQSVTTDNYDENSEYVQNLKATFKDNPKLLRKYLYGDWSVVDSINQLIPSEAILKSAYEISGTEVTSLGVDVARYGDDRTVFTILKNGNIELIESYLQTAITEVVTRTIQLINDYQIDPNYVGIDSVGVGAGVIDSLKQQGYNVIEISGGAKPEENFQEETFKPHNLRSQVYWQLRNDFVNGNIGNLNNEGLKLELQSITYEIYSDKTVKIIGKDAIKRILGKSPDLADSLAYANWVREYRGMPILAIPPSAGR